MESALPSLTVLFYPQIALVRSLLLLLAATVLLCAYLWWRLRQKTRTFGDESEDRFRMLFERGGVGMALLSPVGKFVQVNPALIRLLGYSAAELIGRSFIDLMYEEDRSGTHVALGHSDAPHYEREKRFVHQDSHLVWLRVVRVPLCDSQGAIRFHATFFIDVSGHRGAEEALREQRRMEEQLNRVRRMETLVTLVGGIAHDFNNQLTAILGNLDMMRVDLERWQHEGKAALETMRPCMQGAEQGALRCARMTSQLLTFSRGRIGAMQTIALESLLAQILSDLQPDMSGIQIETNVPPNIEPVTVDTVQIRELLVNLAANAREAMPDGGTLTVALANRTFDADDCSTSLDVRPGSFVELSVRDTGHGMPPEIRERIFEPFFTTKKPPQGAGMGLSVVFGIVKGHKGWITVESQPGAGTAFRIYLPTARKSTPPLASRHFPEPARANAERILLVDDEPLVRDLAKTVLERSGFQVISAEDGEQALAIFRREGQAVDLILLDYIMPRMNGVEVLKKLQQIDADVRVVFSSGYHTDYEVDQLLAAGALAFVPKPYRPQDLVQTIRRILNLRAHQES